MGNRQDAHSCARRVPGEAAGRGLPAPPFRPSSPAPEKFPPGEPRCKMKGHGCCKNARVVIAPGAGRDFAPGSRVCHLDRSPYSDFRRLLRRPKTGGVAESQMARLVAASAKAGRKAQKEAVCPATDSGYST